MALHFESGASNFSIARSRKDKPTQSVASSLCAALTHPVSSGILVAKIINKDNSQQGAPMPDYDLPARGNVPLAYVLSAVLGIVIIAIVIWLFTLLLTAGKAPAHSQS
jgi:hypothetical protein